MKQALVEALDLIEFDESIAEERFGNISDWDVIKSVRTNTGYTPS